MHRLQYRLAALLAALAALIALLLAYGSEWLLGLVPCGLCLIERWPWRVALVLAIVAALLGRLAGRVLLFLVIPVLVVSVGLGVLHVGVEQHFWPSPLPECNAPELHGNTAAELLASMPARPSKPCDAPSDLIPGLPLSMAAMNLIWSLVVLGLLAAYLAESRDLPR